MTSRNLDLRGDDALDLPAGVTSTETELTFSADLPYAEWGLLGGRLGRAHSAVQWWLGDWLLFGEARYRDGETYEQALEETGRSLGGLYNLRSVSKRVPRSVRRPDLSWSHHRAVASLPVEAQEEWLAKAAENSWSVDVLRDVLREEDLIRPIRSARALAPEEASRRTDVPSQDGEAANRADENAADGTDVQWEPAQLPFDESLRSVAREIADAPPDERGWVCLDRNVLERLRRALEATS